MGFKRQDALIESRLQDRVDNSNDFILLNWLCRRTYDKNPPDEPHRCDLYQILDETSIKTIKTIRRRLKAMDKTGMIRYSESAKRYGYMCEIRIIDPAYIDALSRIQGRQIADTLVTGHDDHSQQATDTLVTDHSNHSQKHQSTNAAPKIAANGHRVRSNGHYDHSHSKKKEGKDHRREGRKQKYLDQINNLSDSSFLPLQEAPELKSDAENLIRDMLKHPEICIDPDYITPLTGNYGPGRIFFACCHYLNDRRRETIDGPGALIHRLANPDQFPIPIFDIHESYAACFGNIGNSRFYTDFADKIRDYGDKIDRLKWEREESEVNFCNDNDQTPNTNSVSPPITDQTPASPTIDADRIWSETLRELELTLPKATFSDHLRGTSALHYQSSRLTIRALNVYSRNMLRDRLRSKIEDVLKQVIGHSVQAYFTIPNQPDPERAIPQDTAGTPSPPAAEQKDPDEPVHSRQAQDAERELRQAPIKHSQRRHRDHRRRQSLSTWIPKYSSHHQNGTASQPVRDP